MKDIYQEDLNPIRAFEEHFRKCEPYLKAKFINKVNRESRNLSKVYHYLKKVTSDVCGAIRPKTYDRYRYFVTFLDKAIRYPKVKLFRKKNEVYDVFLKFKSRVENNPKGYRIRIFATNNGGEYVNKRF